MQSTKVFYVVLFLALMVASAAGRISLANKLKAAQSTRLRNYIRRLSLKKSAKQKTHLNPPSKPDPRKLKQKKHFEIMRDFLSGNSHINFRQKLKSLKKKYGRKLDLAESKEQTARLLSPQKTKQAGSDAHSKNRKLQETMIEDELVDFEPKNSRLDMDGHERALSNVRMINSWVTDLESSLDDFREGLNDKIMNLATGLQKRRLMLGHFNQVLNHKPTGRI